MGDYGEKPFNPFIMTHKSRIQCVLCAVRISGWIRAAEMPPVGTCANSESLIRRSRLRGETRVVSSQLLQLRTEQRLEREAERYR